MRGAGLGAASFWRGDASSEGAGANSCALKPAGGTAVRHRNESKPSLKCHIVIEVSRIRTPRTHPNAIQQRRSGFAREDFAPRPPLANLPNAIFSSIRRIFPFTLVRIGQVSAPKRFDQQQIHEDHCHSQPERRRWKNHHVSEPRCMPGRKGRQDRCPRPRPPGELDERT